MLYYNLIKADTIEREFSAASIPGLYAGVAAYLREKYTMANRPIFQRILRNEVIRVDILTEKFELLEFCLKKVEP